MPFLSIRDDSHPHLVFMDEKQAISWDVGRMYLMLLNSRFMRITTRGVQFSFFSDLKMLNKAYWNELDCFPVRGALCEETSGMLLFPSGTIDIPNDLSDLKSNPLLNAFDNRKLCFQENSHRVLLPSDTRYELSLCDLLDSNLDIIYDKANNKLWWHVDDTPYYELIFIFCSALYLMSCVSVNIVRLAKKKQYQATRVEICVVCAVIVFSILSWIFGGLRFLVSSSDVLMLWTLIVFSVVESAASLDVMLFQTAAPEELSRTVQGISLPLACLLLLTARVHYSFENPYTPVLTVIFGVRSWTKFLSFNAPLALFRTHMDFGRIAKRAFVHGVDMTCFCMLLNNIGRSAHDKFDVIQEQAAVAVFSILGGTLLRTQQKRFQPALKPDKD